MGKTTQVQSKFGKFTGPVIGKEGTTSYASQRVTADLATGNTFIHSQTANEDITKIRFSNPPAGVRAVQKVTLIIVNNRGDSGAQVTPTLSADHEIDASGSLCYGDWPAPASITFEDVAIYSFTYVKSLAKGFIEFGEDRSR